VSLSGTEKHLNLISGWTSRSAESVTQCSSKGADWLSVKQGEKKRLFRGEPRDKLRSIPS